MNLKQRGKLPIVVLISGGGTNLQSIIDSTARDLPVCIQAVISNVEDAFGLQRAAKAGITTAILKHHAYPDRSAYDAALCQEIDRHEPGLVVLAGFMRILSPAFVAHYAGRLINIHPSILPALPGLHTHQRAIDTGLNEHGASVHFVSDEVDGGPIIIQAQVPVLTDDSAESLAARVLQQEHRIFPQAIRWFAEDRLEISDGQVLLDGQPALNHSAGS